DAAGLVLYVSGFFGLLLADSLLKKMHGRGSLIHTPSTSHGPASWPNPSLRSSATLTALLLVTGIAGLWFKPTQYLAEIKPLPPLAQLVPEQMGQWATLKHSEMLLVVPDDESLLKQLYHQTLSRIYTNSQGQQMMLSVAYGGHQFGNELQADRPEACYKAAGFELLQSNDVSLSLKGSSLKVRQLVALRRDRIEPVTYWMTVGETPTLPGLARKWVQFQHGWGGQVPDGFLVRVSSIDNIPERAFELQADFIAAMQSAGLGRMGLQQSKGPV
ncbi:MAG: exosortase C-terminal domain/associated protein EpsI, partial [Hylemonella sp.]